MVRATVLGSAGLPADPGWETAASDATCASQAPSQFSRTPVCHCPRLTRVVGMFIWPQIDDQRQCSLVTTGAQTRSDHKHFRGPFTCWPPSVPDRVGHSPLPRPITERDQVWWLGAAGSARNADHADL